MRFCCRVLVCEWWLKPREVSGQDHTPVLNCVLDCNPLQWAVVIISGRDELRRERKVQRFVSKMVMLKHEIKEFNHTELCQACPQFSLHSQQDVPSRQNQVGLLKECGWPESESAVYLLLLLSWEPFTSLGKCPYPERLIFVIWTTEQFGYQLGSGGIWIYALPNQPPNHWATFFFSACSWDLQLPFHIMLP